MSERDSNRDSNLASNTAVLDRIDARGRAAAAGLRSAVSTMPVLDAPERARPQWLRPALAMAGVVSLVAGLVAVLVALANRPADVANPGAPDTRWVLDSPPEGFTVAGAAGPGEGISGDTSFLIRVDVYTEVADSSSPVLTVGRADFAGEIEGEPVDLGGVDGVLGDDPTIPGRRAVGFGAGSARQVVAGRGVSDDLLVAAATELAAGRSVLAVLPEGFAEYLDVSLLDAGALSGVVAARGEEIHAELAMVGYTREGDDQALVYLAVQPDSLRAQAALSAFTDVVAPVDGLPDGRVVSIGDELQAVVWRSDGLLFAVAGTEPAEVLVAAAKTARPSSAEEWQRLVAQLPANDDDEFDVTSVTVPADPVEEGSWSGEVGGQRWEVRAKAPDVDRVEVVIDGDVIFEDRRDEEVWLRVLDNGEITAVYAIVPEGFPGSLEVTTTSGGSSMVPLPAAPRLVAAVVPSDEFVSAEWLADNGEVLFDTNSSVIAFDPGTDGSWVMVVVAVDSSDTGDNETVLLVHPAGASAFTLTADAEPGVLLIDAGDDDGRVPAAVVATAVDAGWTMVVHLLDGTTVERAVLVPVAAGGLPVAAALVAEERIAYVELLDPSGAAVQRYLCASPPAEGSVPCQ